MTTIDELSPGVRVVVDAASRDSFAGSPGIVDHVNAAAEVPVAVHIPGEIFPIRFHAHELRLDEAGAGR